MIRVMYITLIILMLSSFTALASPIGMSTYPFSDGGGAISAELTGYMNKSHEVGAGLRFTQGLNSDQNFDLYGSGSHGARSYQLGAGFSQAILSEEESRPFLGLKAFVESQKFEDTRFLSLGGAPTIRKTWSVDSFEFNTYLAVPMGMKLNNETDAFDFFAATVLGYASVFPGFDNKNLILSVEGMKNMGKSDDALAILTSWMWN